jgi:hypothetical protein
MGEIWATIGILGMLICIVLLIIYLQNEGLLCIVCSLLGG